MSLIGDLVQSVFDPNRDQHAIPMLDGPLSPKTDLDGAREVASGFDQPDDVVVGADGALYVSDNRSILRCEPPNFAEVSVWARFEQRVSALAVHPGGGLVVGLDGNGLCRLDAQGTPGTSLRCAGDRPLNCVTALVVAADGGIYIANGSQHTNSHEWLQNLMSARGSSGGIFLADSELRTAEIKMSGLAWPYGLTLTDAGNKLWFNQAWSHALSYVEISTGSSRKVQSNTAYYPARPRADASGALWQACFALRSPLVELVLRESRYREEMIATISPELWIGPSLRAGADCREPAQFGSLRKLGIHKPWAPARSYGLVVKLSSRGEPCQSWHSRVDGSCHGVTSVCPLTDGRVIIVSKGHGKVLWLVDTPTVGVA
jgi:sugar lactone lactonase YvrE